MRRKNQIFDATRGRQSLMPVAETRCPRYYRLSPNFRDNVAASQRSKMAIKRHCVVASPWP